MIVIGSAGVAFVLSLLFLVTAFPSDLGSHNRDTESGWSVAGAAGAGSSALEQSDEATDIMDAADAEESVGAVLDDFAAGLPKMTALIAQHGEATVKSANHLVFILFGGVVVLLGNLAWSYSRSRIPAVVGRYELQRAPAPMSQQPFRDGSGGPVPPPLAGPLLETSPPTMQGQVLADAPRAVAARLWQPNLAEEESGARRWTNVANGVAVVVGGFDYCFEVGRFNHAPSGHRFVVFGVGVANSSAGNIHVNPFDLTLVDQRGSTYAYHPSTHSARSRPLGPVDVRPGDYAEGCLVFLISASTVPARIIYRPSVGTEVVVNLEELPLPPQSGSDRYGRSHGFGWGGIGVGKLLVEHAGGT